tara:strand:- start:46438 stop:46596 length:159 start_codon:yes stop_codon:yes gene_type:complete
MATSTLSSESFAVKKRIIMEKKHDFKNKKTAFKCFMQTISERLTFDTPIKNI